jgi:monolysocardiolipin acyltransferase
LNENNENKKNKKIGKLKWGVGKLIAHSPTKIIFIPFFFTGTEKITPQDANNKISFVPKIGYKVRLKFGKEVNFDDLIEKHEKKFNKKMWKYSSSVDKEFEKNLNILNNNNTVNNDNNNNTNSSNNNHANKNFHVYWDSQEEDLELYSAITLRIENSLNYLNDLSKENI